MDELVFEVILRMDIPTGHSFPCLPTSRCAQAR